MTVHPGAVKGRVPWSRHMLIIIVSWIFFRHSRSPKKVWLTGLKEVNAIWLLSFCEVQRECVMTHDPAKREIAMVCSLSLLADLVPSGA